MTQFKAEVFQNAFVPQGAGEVNAIMTVSAEGTEGMGTPGIRIIGIICDNSGSMDGGKIHAAKDAMVRMVWMLPADAWFFVIAGAENAELVVPAVQASSENKQRAIAAIKRIRAVGGTCISTWLGKAIDQFGDTFRSHQTRHPAHRWRKRQRRRAAPRRHAGRSRRPLSARMPGRRFDREIDELKKISGKLLGTTDIISRPDLIEPTLQHILRGP